MRRSVLCVSVVLLLCLALSPKSVLLASSEDQVPQQQPLWSWRCPAGSSNVIESVTISSDGSYIVAANQYGEIYFFSRFSSVPLWSYTTYSWPEVAISSDGGYIAARSDYVYLFSRTSSTPLWSGQTGDQVYSVAISSDGGYIVAGDLNYRVYLFGRELLAPPSETSDGTPGSTGQTRSKYDNWLWLILLYFVISAILAAWVYHDSRNRRMNRGAWAGFTFLTSVVGLVAYLKQRRPRRTFR